MTKLELLQKLIDVSDNIVILTGAGFSTASNIPDFRSDNGLYKVKGTSIPQKKFYPIIFLLVIQMSSLNIIFLKWYIWMLYLMQGTKN